VVAGRFTHTDHPGANRFRFAGDIAGRRLRPGFYLLDATPDTDAGPGRTASVVFQVLG
jgi:hypothetical protein